MDTKEAKSQPLINLSLSEVCAEDGAKDHKLSLHMKMGNARMEFDTTFDKIREFFTKRRKKSTEKAQAAT